MSLISIIFYLLENIVLFLMVYLRHGLMPFADWADCIYAKVEHEEALQFGTILGTPSK
jgi:hypothetical protein